MARTHEFVPSGGTQNGRRNWRWLGLTATAVSVALLTVGAVVLHRASPILKERVLETLSTRFNSRVELQSFHVSLLRGLEVSGTGLRIYPQSNIVATDPLIAIEQFRFHSGVLGLFVKPMHVRAVELSGLQIRIPPRGMGQHAPSKKSGHTGDAKIVVERIICNNSRLVIGTSNPNKNPKEFELKHIELQDVGAESPWKYNAVLTNAVPRGEIHSSGKFGPWQTERPGNSFVTGHYTFEHADLNTIKGIGGMLSSVGDFTGQLDRIVIDGTTETPAFSLHTANHPLPLHTRFHAIVDGTSGDTYLQPVEAKLRNSSFTTSGTVVNIKGSGHQIELDVDVESGQLQDFLDLSVKTEPAIMIGLIKTKAKLRIRPGKESVTQKLSLQGSFSLGDIHFTHPGMQDRVDMLSMRARGEPNKAKPGVADVNSQMTGNFQMANGVMEFSDLVYALPGARAYLQGEYTLNGKRFEFSGKVLTDAPLSHMVDSRWTAALLKAVSPFFKNKAGGAEIPVRISGTNSEPKFGLDVLKHHSHDEKPSKDQPQ